MVWNVLWIFATAATAFVLGLCLGKREEKKSAGRGRENKEEAFAWLVGSPVSGEIAYAQEGEHPTVVILPSEDKLYAPAGGKITRIYPAGNEFLFRTEFGAELHIRAGDAQEELLEQFCRPRIVQNEIVGKGKLLLEFDRQGIEDGGGSPQVSVRLENGIYGSDVRFMAEGSVRTGEEILGILEHCCGDIPRD